MHAAVTDIQGQGDPRRPPAPLVLVPGSASTSETTIPGVCRSADSRPKAKFPVHEASSTTHALQSHKPLLASAASWRLILQSVTYVLGHHTRPLQNGARFGKRALQ